MDQGVPTTPSHDPFWTAVGSAILSLFLGGGVAWREWRSRKIYAREQRESKAADRANENWLQARELREEQEKRILRLEAERAELIHRDLERQRELFAKEHVIGNLKTKLAAMTVRYNAAARILKSLAIDDWEDLPLYPESNGGHEPPTET